MVRGTRNSTRAITPIRETRLSSSTTDPLTATGRRVLRSHTKNGSAPDAEAEQQSPSKRPSASRTLAARGRTRRSSAAEFNLNKLPHDTSPIKESSPIKADAEEMSRSEQPITPSAAPRTRKGRASSGKRASIVYRSENPEQSDNIESSPKKEEDSANSPLRALNAENINNRSPVRLRSSPRKKASVNLEYAEKKSEVGSPTKDLDQSNEVSSQSPTVASSPVKQTDDESSADSEAVTMPAETEQAAEVEPTDTQLPPANTEEVHQQLDPNDSMIVEVPGAYLDPALVPHSNSSTFNSPVQIANSSKPPSQDGSEQSVTYTEQLFSASSPIAITTSMIDPALLSSPPVAPNSYAVSYEAPPSPSLLSTPTSLPWERADNSVIEECMPLSTVVSPEAVIAVPSAEEVSTTDLTQVFSPKPSSTPADDDMARRKMIARKREEEIAAHRSAYYDRLKREFKIPHIPNTPSRLAVSRTSYDTSTEVTSDCAPSSPLAATAASAAVAPSSPVVARPPSKQEVVFTRTLSAESDSDSDEFMDTVESIDIAPVAPSAPIQPEENAVVEETISTQTEAQENVDAESRSAEDVSSMADVSTTTDSDTEPEVFVEALSPLAHAQSESAESATSTAAADETSLDVSNLSTINRWERQVRRREGFWSQSAINTPAGTPMQQQQQAGPGSSALRFALSLISPIRRASPAPVRVHSPLKISTTVEAEEAKVVFSSPLKVASEKIVEEAAEVDEEAVECSKADSVVDEDIELPDVDIEAEAETSVLSEKADTEAVSIEKQAETSMSHTEASFTDEESVVTAKNELSINNEDEDKEEESSSASSFSSSDADAASDSNETVAPAVADEPAVTDAPAVVEEEQEEEQQIIADESVSENVDIPASVEIEEGDEEVEMDVDNNCSGEIEAQAEMSADDAESEAAAEDAAEDAAENVDAATVTVSETAEVQTTEEVREPQSEAEVSVEVDFVEAVTGEEDTAANVSAEDSTRGEEFHECSVAPEIYPDTSEMATPETEAQAEVEAEAEVETTEGSDTAALENESTEKSELEQAEHESAEDTTAITQTSDKSDVSSGEVDYTSVLPWHISLDKWAESNKRKRAVVEEPAPVASTQGDAAAEAEIEATSTEKKPENAVEDEESQRPRKKVRSSSRSVNSRNEEPAKQPQRAQIPLPRKKQPATAARASRRGRGAAEQSSLSTASSIPVVSSRASETSTATAATATPARATRSRAGTRGGAARAPDTPKPMVRSGGLGGGAGNAPLVRITATNSRLNNGYENNVIPQYQRIEAPRPDSPPLDKRRKRLFESPLGRERAISFAERVVVAGNGRGKKSGTATRKDEKKPKKGIMKQAPGRLDEFGNALDVVSVPAKDTVRVRHRLYLGEQEEPTRYARKENIR
ncbi:hypothetical protein BZA70DRAFT_297433 [Myxozyma melibiosi]|uniref:Uncharacterized protein n=1 Tax=Myxozyma melibiosi TaxID=54550 RepID=A0ABR1EZ72_9ASCO